MRAHLARTFAVVVVLCCGAASAAAERRVAASSGEHSWRFATRTGTLRVWRPAHYDWHTAGIVVYVHGFRTDVDAAWKQHKLADKFRASGRNALFIVAGGPDALDKPVVWPSLGKLVSVALRLARQRRPKGRLVVAGHSGAYLTIVKWLAYQPLDYIILLDGLYACEPFFEQWLYKAKGHRNNRLVMVGYDSIKWADPWVKRISGVVTLDKIPARARAVSARARAAKVLYMRSQYEHMALIERDDVLPLLLELAPL